MAAPAGSRKATVAFNFISERTVLFNLCFTKSILYVRCHILLVLCLFSNKLQNTSMGFGYICVRLTNNY